MNTIEVYKVVQRFHGKLFSSVMRDDCVAVEYRLLEVARPKIEGSPLIAFSSLDAARDWLGMCWKSEEDGYRILRCEAEEWPMELDPFYARQLPGDYNINATRAYTFWNFKGSWDDLWAMGWWPVPKGTVFCKWIKPLEVV